jgi:hypothetical protein
LDGNWRDSFADTVDVFLARVSKAKVQDRGLPGVSPFIGPL